MRLFSTDRQHMHTQNKGKNKTISAQISLFCLVQLLEMQKQSAMTTPVALGNIWRSSSIRTEWLRVLVWNSIFWRNLVSAIRWVSSFQTPSSSYLGGFMLSTYKGRAMLDKHAVIMVNKRSMFCRASKSFHVACHPSRSLYRGVKIHKAIWNMTSSFDCVHLHPLDRKVTPFTHL